MRDIWTWIAGVVVVLGIVALLVAGRGDRQGYWTGRGPEVQRAPQVTPTPIDRLMQRSPGQ